MMFVVSSTLQLLLAVVLCVLVVCGNLMIPFLSCRTTRSCPQIIVLTALDFTAALLGPGLTIVTLTTGRTWLENNPSLCQALSFLSSCVQISCFLALFFLALFCQKVHHNAHSDGKRRVIRTEFAFVVLCLLTGLLWGVIPLFGWSSYQGLYFLHSCLFANRFQTISNYSLFYLVFSFVVLSVTALLTLRAKNLSPAYSVQFFWKRHESEMKISDPESTTVGSSNMSVYESGMSSFQPKQQSARSSMSSHGRPDVSFGSSPAQARKSSKQVRELDNSILEILLSNIQQRNIPGFSHSANASNRNSGEDTTSLKTVESVSPATSGLKGFHRSYQSSAHSAIPRDILRDPFIISSRIPHKFPVFSARKNHFQNMQALPQLNQFQQQRSLSRLLLLRCCVTAICWLPLYIIAVLQLSAALFPQEFPVFSQWLVFIQSSIAPLFPLIDAGYKRSLRRAASSAFKVCRCGNKANLHKSRDVEFKIEQTQQVRLSKVKPVEVEKQTLNNIRQKASQPLKKCNVDC